MKTTAREIVAARAISASPLVLQITCKDGSSDSYSLAQMETELTAGARAKVRMLACAQTTHGGPRRNQGRRAADGATGLRRVNVTIDDTSADKLRAHGDGDLSLGIRRAAATLPAATPKG